MVSAERRCPALALLQSRFPNLIDVWKRDSLDHQN